MKILHVMPSLGVKSGGPTVALFGMVRALQGVGVEVDVTSSDADIEGNIPAYAGCRMMEQEVPIYYFRSPILGKYGFCPTMNNWLKSNISKYDLVHIHGIFAYTSIVSALLARRADVGYVLRTTGELDPIPLQKSFVLKQIFLKSLGMNFLNDANSIHVTSEHERLGVERLGIKAPIVEIPLGVYSPPAETLPRYGEFKKLYPQTQGKKIVLFLSRLDPIKGLDLFFPALKKAISKRSDIICVIAGSGTLAYEKKIYRLVFELGLENFVIFTGFLEEAKKWAALRDAYIFVCPSYHENFGIASIEALALGIPVIVSDQVAIHREVNEDLAGFVVPCKVDEIAATLETSFADEGLRNRMGENGKRLVRTKFSWPKVAEQIKELYRSLLTNQSRFA